MGRRLDVLLGRTTKQTARLKSLLGLAVTRLGVVRAHRQVRCAQARGDVEQLLRLGHAEYIVREQNALDALAELEAYCGLIVERAALVDAHKGECPEEMREAVAGLVYAAARCGDLPELQEVRAILAAKFGREFVSAASNLRSGCGISAKIVQKLSTKQPSLESRQLVLQEIAAEKGMMERGSEDSGRSGHSHSKTKHDDGERIRRTPPVDDISGDSAQRFTDVEAAAQAAFESAASAAAAAKAAMELSRGQPRGPGDRRTMQRVPEVEKQDEVLDGKKSEKIWHDRNYSPEVEIMPEDEANHGNVAATELKQREPGRGKPASVRTKWVF